MNSLLNQKEGTPIKEKENPGHLYSEVLEYLESRRRWTKAFDFISSLFVKNSEWQDSTLSNVEKSIFKLQHTINFLNCANVEEQKKYLTDKLLKNQSNYKEFAEQVLIALLTEMSQKEDLKGKERKRHNVFLRD